MDFRTEAMDSFANKMRWKMMMEIKKSIQNVGGFIFGGLVRDQIIHDHHADHFYESVADKMYSPAEIDALYKDPKYLPEHIDRCVMPDDIDCFMTTKALKKLTESELKKRHYSVRIKKSQQANFYFLKHNSLSELLHTKLQIRFCVNGILTEHLDLSKYTVDVDIVHTDNPDINMYQLLSQNFDFECNSLLLTPDNELKLCAGMNKYLTPFEKMKKIGDIADDIKAKRARILPDMRDVPSFRMFKMLDKGWSIEGYAFQVIRQTIPYDGHCLICHETIESNIQHIKDKHCDARFHTKCFLQMIRHQNFNHKCPLCKNNCCVTRNEEVALQMLNDAQIGPSHMSVDEAFHRNSVAFDAY